MGQAAFTKLSGFQVHSAVLVHRTKYSRIVLYFDDHLMSSHTRLGPVTYKMDTLGQKVSTEPPSHPLIKMTLLERPSL